MRSVFTVGAMCVMAACGGNGSSLPKATALSADGARHAGASYSPDGARIAWWEPAADSTFNWQLWVADADFSSPIKLPVTGQRAPVVWSPDGRMIAATTQQFGVGSVVVVPSAGGEVRRVTHGPGFQSQLAWHHDGDRLAYVESAEGGTLRTSVVSLSTGKTTPFIPGETRPLTGFWSPDGSHIAYQVFDGSKVTLWVADGAGGHARQLTSEGFESYSLSVVGPWSPDSKELLYESRRTGTSDLWVMPIDGGKARQLTRDVRNDYSGSWSSDGKWVAFLSDRGRQLDVWVTPSTGGAERRITDTKAEETEAPQWRPRTHELVFVSTTLKSAHWALEIADGKERQLTTDSIRTSYFDLSPDGKQLAFVIDRGGGIQDLAIMPLGGGTSRTLLSGGGTVDGPTWSPDGSKIAFSSDRGGTADIWTIDAAGGAPRQIESWPGSETFPTWSGDGSALYFLSDRDTRLSDVWKVPSSGGEPVRVTHDGGLNFIVAQAGIPDVYVSTVGHRAGQFAVSRLGVDGSLQVIWDKTNSFPGTIAPKGDSIILSVEQPNGKMQDMLFPAKGGQGRVLLPPTERAGNWSKDGKFVLYRFRANGANDIGVLTVADGSKRRLTRTPESEGGAAWTPDGKTVVFIREKTVARIFTADLSRLLSGAK